MAYTSTYNSLHCNEEFDLEDENMDDYYAEQNNLNYDGNHEQDSEEGNIK